MKLQIEDQHLRLRIDEDELARLLAGGSIHARTQFADAFAIGFEVMLVETDEASLAGLTSTWKIFLPERAVREHATRLPTREGLRFVLTGGRVEAELTLLFDVDVRDSVRRRKSP